MYVDRYQIPGWGDFWAGIVDGELCYLKLPCEAKAVRLQSEKEVPPELEQFAQRWDLDLKMYPTEPMNAVWTQLTQYLDGNRRKFDLPLMLLGTDFQQMVWQGLLTIPWGEVRTYGDIARALGNPRLARAVGQANGRNPVSIIVPCHRIVAAGGLGGYAGGLDNKRRLLRLEGVL